MTKSPFLLPPPLPPSPPPSPSPPPLLPPLPLLPPPSPLQVSREDNTDSAGALKNYVLCTESEEEMQAWIAAITEEIKPMIGANIYSKGGSGAGKNAIKVDQKALDEVRGFCSGTCTGSHSYIANRISPKVHP